MEFFQREYAWLSRNRPRRSPQVLLKISPAAKAAAKKGPTGFSEGEGLSSGTFFTSPTHAFQLSAIHAIVFAESSVVAPPMTIVWSAFLGEEISPVRTFMPTAHSP